MCDDVSRLERKLARAAAKGDAGRAAAVSLRLDAAREGIVGAWQLLDGRLTSLPEWDLEE